MPIYLVHQVQPRLANALHGMSSSSHTTEAIPAACKYLAAGGDVVGAPDVLAEQGHGAGDAQGGAFSDIHHQVGRCHAHGAGRCCGGGGAATALGECLPSAVALVLRTSGTDGPCSQRNKRERGGAFLRCRTNNASGFCCA